MSNILHEKKYKKIIDENAEGLELWVSAINNYRSESNTKLSYEDTYKQVDEISTYLHEFFKVFIKYGKFKDSFIKPTSFQHVEGIVAHVMSQKMSLRYSFGFDYSGLYLESYIPHVEYLKNVPDNFWNLFLSLSQFGDFKFKENAGFDNEIRRDYQHLFKPTKSNVFRLMRNYFLREVLEEENQPPKYSKHIDTGWFSIRWTPDKYSMEEILVLGCDAFKTLYQLNYLLWKAQKQS